MKGLINEEGHDSIIPIQYIRDRICSEETARKVRECIKEVVWGEHGTARAVRDDRVCVVGKTGTAYPVEKGVYNTAKRRYAFAGFFPYEAPRYSCIALVLGPSGTSANRTSGQIVKNMALKMYSRGLLDNKFDYADGKGKGVPVVDASTKSVQNLASKLGVASVKRVRTKPLSSPQVMPDVKGYDALSAISILEKSGMRVKLKGEGRVVAQSIDAGTQMRPGSEVILTLKI